VAITVWELPVAAAVAAVVESSAVAFAAAVVVVVVAGQERQPLLPMRVVAALWRPSARAGGKLVKKAYIFVKLRLHIW
jgi:uncharacterized hydantoinase/oxoprolinase family protein